MLGHDFDSVRRLEREAGAAYSIPSYRNIVRSILFLGDLERWLSHAFVT